MAVEPSPKRVVAFFDGQNLYHAGRRCFGRNQPDYDAIALATRVAKSQLDWNIVEVRFYTGIHSLRENAFWHQYWSSKLGVLGSRGVVTFTRQLRYQTETLTLPDGTQRQITLAQEKGVDVRIALDIVRLARAGSYDVALVFSQDQDLSEAADEVRAISKAENRWLKVACAYPCPTGEKRRGINGTSWIRIDQATYEQCLDPVDHRPKAKVRGN